MKNFDENLTPPLRKELTSSRVEIVFVLYIVFAQRKLGKGKREIEGETVVAKRGHFPTAREHRDSHANLVED